MVLKPDDKMKNFLLYIFPVFLLAFLLVNVFFDSKEFADKNEAIAYYSEVEDYISLSQIYNDLLREDSTNVHLHYSYLEAYFNQEKSFVLWESSGSELHLDKAELVAKYNGFLYRSIVLKANNEDSLSQKVKDIGYFGLGVINYNLQLFDKAFDCFNSISDPEFPYLNYFKGRYYHYINFEESNYYYQVELALNKQANFVYQKQAHLFKINNKIDDLSLLLNNPVANDNIKTTTKRFLFFHQKSIIPYLKSIVERVLNKTNSVGLIGASLILFTWFVYLLLIRSRSRNKIGFIVLALALGIAFALLTSFITDVITYYFDFKLNGEWVNDFLYAILGIGFVEEAVKIVPFLIILALNKNIKEPIDYLFYAGLTALGFSFLENLIYFDKTGIRSIQGRALTATVTHLFNTSLIAYGIVIGKFSAKKSVGLNFFVFFFLAAISHGFYDFWLINSDASRFSFITFVYLLVTMVVWVSLINNCINNSYNSQARWRYDPVRINNFLLFSLSFIFLFQYFLIGYKYGAKMANFELLRDLSSGLFLLIFLTISLSKFEYIPNHWAPLKLWDWDVFTNIPMVNPSYFNLSKIIGAKIKITAFGKYGALASQLPLQGVVVSRELLGIDKNWFLISLNQELKIGLKTYQYLLISTRFSNEVFLEKKHQLVQVRLVKDIEQINKKIKLKKDYLFIDLARVQLIEEMNG